MYMGGAIGGPPMVYIWLAEDVVVVVVVVVIAWDIPPIIIGGPAIGYCGGMGVPIGGCIMWGCCCGGYEGGIFGLTSSSSSDSDSSAAGRTPDLSSLEQHLFTP